MIPVGIRFDTSVTWLLDKFHQWRCNHNKHTYGIARDVRVVKVLNPPHTEWFQKWIGAFCEGGSCAGTRYIKLCQWCGKPTPWHRDEISDNI